MTAVVKVGFREGTRKQSMFERFLAKGDKEARLYASRAGLSKNTVSNWLVTFRKMQKAKPKAAKKANGVAKKVVAKKVNGAAKKAKAEQVAAA
jgi:hypothetical protein